MKAEDSPLLTEEQRAMVRKRRSGTDRMHPDMQGLLDILDYELDDDDDSSRPYNPTTDSDHVWVIDETENR